MVSWMVSTCEPLVVPTTPPARVSVPPPLKVTFAPAIIKRTPAAQGYIRSRNNQTAATVGRVHGDLPSVVDSRAVYPKIVSVFEPQAVVTIDSQVVDDAVDVQRY